MKDGRYEDGNGSIWWYLNNQLHRDGDLPAVELSHGTKMWLRHNKHHRTNGPAIEWAGGEGNWFLEGERIDCKTQEEFERMQKLKAFW